MKMEWGVWAGVVLVMESQSRHAVATGATDSSNGTKNDQYGRNTFFKQD